MPLMTRSVTLQARVRPELKYASEQVLRSTGLSMTEALELFLRRLIVDQKLPFEMATLDEAMLANIVASWEVNKEKSIELGTDRAKKNRKRQKRE